MGTSEVVDYDKVKSYLKKISESYSKVDKFIGFNEKELHIELNKKKGIPGTLLSPFKYEGSLNGNNQRTLAGRVIHFGVLRSISKIDDYDLESATIAECENIGFGVLSRIYYDSKNPNSKWLYKNFDQNTVEFNELRLKSALGLVGMEFAFTLKTSQPLVLDVNEWSDIDTL
ncbi:hypothetical protein [Aquimarina aggregata]|uniref:hypothetical protein n=1 Tax=Aquimarina aggregata TaxID=1642818 RepID=UPI0024931687|nr:hypothetical protein [Aquimarina aggregata]